MINRKLTDNEREALIDAVAADWLGMLREDNKMFEDWFYEAVIEGRIPLSEYGDEDLIRLAIDADLEIVGELGLSDTQQSALEKLKCS